MNHDKYLALKNNIYTNLNFGHPFTAQIKNGEPRKILTEILKTQLHSIILIGSIFVGRRAITENNLMLLNGRRHRIYYALKINHKIYIKFGWHKIKKLTEAESQHMTENWSFDYFTTKGQIFIEKSGGIHSYHHLLYTKTLNKKIAL